VQRQIKGFTAQAGYVANRTIRQTNFLDLNAGQVIGAGNNGRPFFPSLRRTTTTAVVDPLGHSVYDSLQVKIDRRFANGLNFGIGYTLSKAFGVCCNASNDGGPAVQALQYMDLNNAYLPFDRRQNFQMTYSYQLPFGKGKSMLTSGVGSWLAGGWQVTGLLSAYTGAPFTVNADGTSLNLPGSTQFADQIATPRKLGNYGRGQAYYDWTTFKSVTNSAGAAEARFGTARLNTLRAPGIFNTDLGVHRSFRFTERVNLQFRAEALNLTNTPQLAGPSTNISGLRTANGNFTGGVFEITGTANTGRDGLVQRAIRLGMRLQF
jgi:3',5'-cyclic AMP phosphodiesterase CpdA